MTDQEELELLELEKEYASVQSQPQKQKPMFSSIAEANTAMQQANVEQNRARINASGINPYVNAMSQSAEQAMPMALGGGVGAGLLRQAGGGLLKQAMAGGAGGAVTGGLTEGDIGQRASMAGLGAVTGGAIGAAVPSLSQALRQLPNRLSGDKSAKFANELRQAFVDTKRQAVKKFGQGLDELANKNPSKEIKLFENANIQEILTDPNLSTEAKSVFNKTPILRDIVTGKRGDNVTVKEAQDIANYLQNKIPASIKSQHLDIAEMTNEVKLAQAQAFPKEMASLRSEYGRIAQPYKDLKGQFRFNSLLNSIDKNFGGAEGKTALKELFKDNPELLAKIGGYKNAGKVLSGIKWSALGLAGKAGFDKVTGR